MAHGDSSGRPHLDELAEARAAQRQARTIDAPGTPSPEPVGDTYARVFVQPTEPATGGDGARVWFQTDPVTGDVVDILVEA